MTTPFPVDEQLLSLAVAYRNAPGSLIADHVMPVIPTGTKRFRWTYFDEGAHFTVPKTFVGRKSQPSIVEVAGVERTHEVIDYGLDDIIPIDDISQAAAAGQGHDPVASAVELLTNLMMLDRERRVANFVQDSNNYKSTLTKTISEAGKKWDKENSDPVDDILSALDKPWVRPNILVLGREVWTVLRRHKKLAQATVSSAAPGVVTRAQAASVFELDAVLVGDSYINSARPGKAVSLSRAWGNFAALLHVRPGGASHANMPSWGYTARFGDMMVGRFDEQKIGVRGSVVVRLAESCRELVASPSAGFLFQAPTAS